MNAPDIIARRPRLKRAALWAALFSLLVVAQTLLVALTVRYESARVQDETDNAAAEASAEVRRQLTRVTQALQGLLWDAQAQRWPGAVVEALREIGRAHV